MTGNLTSASANDRGRSATTLIAGSVVVDMGRRGRPVAVLELIEEPLSWWWILARSPSVPPHRLEEATGRANVYARQLWPDGVSSSPALDDDVDELSLAEIAARRENCAYGRILKRMV